MSHMSNEFSKLLELELLDSDCCVGLVVKGCTSKSLGSCVADIELNGQNYQNVSFSFKKSAHGCDFRTRFHE